MNTLHAKSPCCGVTIWRRGARRRQCRACKRLWRIRHARRGRKKKRTGANLLGRYLRHEIPSLAARARVRGVSPDTLERRLVASRDYVLSHTPWPPLPEHGKCIVVADAFFKHIERRWCTVYLMLVRPVEDTDAVIAPPYVREGTETAAGWYAALDTLPEHVRKRVVALVSDGHRGLISYAMWSGWIVQRCHYHLIASIQGRRSRWAASRHRAEGERLYQLVKHILTTTDEEAVMPAVSEVEEIGWHTSSPELKKVISGFVTNVRDYRAYLYHPQLNLPTTNNAVESLISTIKALRQRARGFRTRASLEKWIAALIKERRTMKCNGYRAPN